MDTLQKNTALEIIESTKEELNILNELGEEFKQYSEMSNQDRAFLNTLVLRKQPKRLLELGVSKGASSIIMLNAIKNIEGAHLYSIDYKTEHYRLKDKLTGFYVDNFPELKEKWTLKTGGLALNFMEEIGGDIDFCLIDTAHCNPGEILDFLMILPYLKNDAIVVFHDTNLQTFISLTKNLDFVRWEFTNNILMSAITGKKFIPDESLKSSTFTNIGAIELNEKTKEHIWEIFNLLTIKWQYMLKPLEIEQIYEFLEKQYGNFFVEYFKNVVQYQKDFFQIDKKNKQDQNHKKERNKLFYSLIENNHRVISCLGVKIKIKRGEQ